MKRAVVQRASAPQPQVPPVALAAQPESAPVKAERPEQRALQVHWQQAQPAEPLDAARQEPGAEESSEPPVQPRGRPELKERPVAQPVFRMPAAQRAWADLVGPQALDGRQTAPEWASRRSLAPVPPVAEEISVWAERPLQKAWRQVRPARQTLVELQGAAARLGVVRQAPLVLRQPVQLAWEPLGLAQTRAVEPTAPTASAASLAQVRPPRELLRVAATQRTCTE